MVSLELCERPLPVAEPEPAEAAPHSLLPEASVDLPSAEVAVRMRQDKAEPSVLRRSMRHLILLAMVVLGVRVFIGEASVVPTASMETTILVGDHLFMNKMLYGPE